MVRGQVDTLFEHGDDLSLVEAVAVARSADHERPEVVAATGQTLPYEGFGGKGRSIRVALDRQYGKGAPVVQVGGSGMDDQAEGVRTHATQRTAEEIGDASAVAGVGIQIEGVAAGRDQGVGGQGADASIEQAQPAFAEPFRQPAGQACVDRHAEKRAQELRAQPDFVRFDLGVDTLREQPCHAA